MANRDGDGWGGNNSSNPRFIGNGNPVSAPSLSGDFHITVLSPAIDAGTSPTNDQACLQISDVENSSAGPRYYRIFCTTNIADTN